jgi:hypothetical protein
VRGVNEAIRVEDVLAELARCHERRLIEPSER